MTKEEILKRFETVEGIYGYMYGRQYVFGNDEKPYADHLIYIDKESASIRTSGFVLDANYYLFDDYGVTWAFTKDDLEPNPYPREEGAKYDD